MIMFIARVYFTYLPYDIYNKAMMNGNAVFADIGLGLIHAQQMFWLANMGLITIFFYPEHFLILAAFCSYLYGVSFIKVNYLKDLPVFHI